MKDYAKRRPSSSAQTVETATTSQQGSRKLPMMIGGLVLVGLFFVLKPTKAPAPEHIVESEAPVLVQKEETVETVPAPEITPKFSFYDILPEQSIVVDDLPVQEVADNMQYVVQVASYREKGKARSMRARLQRLGYTPQIIQTDNDWYRIDIGPVNTVREGNAIRHTIQGQGIVGSIIRQI